MLLEKVIALRAVYPANKSSQPASSQPVSSARKTVSGLAAGFSWALAKRSSGMVCLPSRIAAMPGSGFRHASPCNPRTMPAGRFDAQVAASPNRRPHLGARC